MEGHLAERHLGGTLTPCRNQIPVSHRLTFGMSPPIVNGCQKSNRFR